MPAPPTRQVDFRLYLITDRRLCGSTRVLLERVEGALRGGAGAVQLREKGLDGGDLCQLAAALLEICRRHGAPLLINDRIDVALAVGADGVHLPANSFPVAEARRLLGPGALIGRSTHAAPEIRAARDAGADFAVFGPIFDTASKRAYGTPLGLERLRQAVRGAGLPVFAIGGINAENSAAVAAAGAHGVAAISAVLGTDSPDLAAAALRRPFPAH